MDNLIQSSHTDLINVYSSYYNSTYYVSNSQNPMDGHLRIKNNKIEYFDTGCNSWIEYVPPEFSISLGGTLEMVVDWALRKMKEEQDNDELENKHPALKKAKENYNFLKEMIRNE